ncbi:hypothetical protein [uncultured Polaribacter sp.]|uniref:hypothetical protein n=1 Tax=uncultured Polaribacter sp. TaxID=174711 RepID=UPI002626DFD0|nr:hypothetical protein [uncultured Polaribacter sp.]
MKEQNLLKSNILKLNTFVLLILMLTGVSCKKEIDYETEQDYFEIRKNITYYKGKPFNGILVKTYKSNYDWSEEAEDVNEEAYIEPNIVLETFIERTPYTEGKINGKQKTIIKKSKQLEILFSEMDYVLGYWKSFKRYYSNGNILHIITYKSNKNEWEKQQTYYKNGVVKEEKQYNYKNEVKVNRYYKTGVIKEELIEQGNGFYTIINKFNEDGSPIRK